MKVVLKYFWIFLLGSWIGCIVEEIWCLIRNKCFKIRSSLIHIPLIPIYGFATMGILALADVIGYSMWKLFFIGAVVSAIIEYIFSYAQEKIFKTKSWDYSDFKFNLNGRINLVYVIGFGIISMFIVKYIKKFSFFIESKLSNSFFIKFTILIFILIIIDVIISSIACLRYNQRKVGKKADNVVAIYFDKHYPDSKVEKVYNNSIYVG